MNPNPSPATRWPAGVSGNPQGMPPGTRHRFSNQFMTDLAQVWAEHGRETMLKTAKKSPEAFFATCARLLPRDVELTIQQSFAGLDSLDYEILQACKAALPDANQRQPGDVFKLVLDALRSHQAKVVEIEPTVANQLPKDADPAPIGQETTAKHE
jgi:hypothetical protein